MIKRIKFLPLFIFLSITAYAQENLVPNGGFERHKNTISPYIDRAMYWTGINTVDYYTAPAKDDEGKDSGPHSGKAYTGLRFQKDYKEFMSVRLKRLLKKGQQYELTFYMRLFRKSDASLKEFGAYFSRFTYHENQRRWSAGIVDTVSDDGLINNFQWIRVDKIFTAQGGEHYLTFGNFIHDPEQRFAKIDKHKLMVFYEAYYFIDDVSLTEYQAPALPLPHKVKPLVKKDTVKTWPKQELKTGQAIVLKNILFSSGKAKLLPSSDAELNRLFTLLQTHPKMVIQINGYTDNTGNAAANQKLSEARAKAVMDYLQEKGLKNELHYKGYGSEHPIASNDTEEGKQKNRRVEFVILKQ